MFVETDDGYVYVTDESGLNDWAIMAGWTDAKEFLEEHRVTLEEVIGHAFMTIRGSFIYREPNMTLEEAMKEKNK